MEPAPKRQRVRKPSSSVPKATANSLSEVPSYPVTQIPPNSSESALTTTSPRGLFQSPLKAKAQTLNPIPNSPPHPLPLHPEANRVPYTGEIGRAHV